MGIRVATSWVVIFLTLGICNAQTVGSGRLQQALSETPTARLDVFGGYSRLGDNDQGFDHGWQIGATARFLPGVPWLGVTGHIGENSQAFRHYLVGLAASTNYAGYARGFAHVLVGRTTLDQPTDPMETFQLKVGAGFDVSFLRLQFNGFRWDIPGRPAWNSEFTAGVVLPFCFGGKDESCL